MTADDAKAIIERMKAARPTCEKCERVPLSIRMGRGDHQMLLDIGFELDPHRPAYLRRCDACANGKLFPWADRLDAERVADMLEHDPRCQSAFELSILEETLTGAQMPVAKLPCVLCGAKPGTVCDQAAHDNLDRGMAAMSGFAPPVPQQTYACAKCGELHCTRNHPEFT